MSSKRQLFRSSMIVGVFSLLGGAAGILVETSIAARLGLSGRSDTFYVAFTIPYIITNLLYATGQFSLVPFFGTLDARHSKEDMWRGFSYAVSVIFVILGAIVLLGVATASWVIRGIAPGLNEAQTLVAAQLARWLFLVIVPAGVAEVFRSFLLSQGHFALPSAAGLIRNAIVIAVVIGAFSRLGYYSIVIGYLAGYSLLFVILGGQILVSFPVHYSFALRGGGEAFQNLRGAGAAQLGGAFSWQVVVIVERIIASFLPEGTLTALNYGLKIISTLAEVLAGSVGTVALPALSRAVARQAQPEERKIFQDAIEISIAIVVPVTVFCLLLSRNIIRLVFERGNFTPESTALLAMVFFYYSLSLIPYSFTRVLVFYFFARHEGAVFYRFANLLFGLTLAFDLIYVGGLGMGAKGIPMGLLTASVLTIGLTYQRNLADLRKVFDRSLVWYTFKNLLAGLLAAAVIVEIRTFLSLPETRAANLIYLCVLCGAGSLVFFASLAATRAVPVAQMMAELRRTDE
ncbi:MAG TPA: lipid II flippase MurJ [Terriglobia bacterium]|nr:lipid II flippase MurJ [Terriglobia bacterium]